MIETGTRKARAAGRGATVDKQALVRAALDEIVHNYKQANLSSVAHTYQVSLAYVSECVRAETGRTYKELLQQHRLELAARLLRRSDMTVQQIIAQVGYENTSYFYRPVPRPLRPEPAGIPPQPPGGAEINKDRHPGLSRMPVLCFYS